MPLQMTGGNSGNREDAKPPVDVGFDRQPVENTANNSSGANVQFSQCTGNREAANPPVPSGGTPNDANT
jgi:hypothetical protein